MNIHIKSKKKAFTLVEILVVILIIGLLFVMLVPKISSTTVRAKESGVQTRFNEFRNAASLVLTEHAGLKDVMSSDTDVAGVVKALNEHLDPGIRFDESTITGLYCDNVAKDPWNNKYRLHVKDNTLTFISYGHNNVATHSASDIAAFDFDSEVCDYTLTANYTDGKISISTRGFTKNANSNGEGSETSSLITDGCFRWGTGPRINQIMGFSGTCGHTDEQHKNLVIPTRCVKISTNAFANEDSIESLVVTENVREIYYGAFSNCSNLKRVKLTNTEQIEETFKGCSNLESVDLGNLKRMYGAAFKRCTSLTNIDLPNGMTTIGDEAFYGCTGLTRVDIPDTVISIGPMAFVYVQHIYYSGPDTDVYGRNWGAGALN